MAEIILPLALTLIMGSLGLTLTPADFKRVATAPKGVGIGLINLLLVSPFLAFLIADVYGLAATLAVGLVLLGASPGGTTANMLTHLARGDVALSVSMTAVSSVASVITVPLFLSLGADYFDAQDVSDEISMPGIAARVFFITIVPLSIGMLIRARRTAWALQWMGTARKVAVIALVLAIAVAVASEFEVLTDAFAEIAAAVVTLNVLAMTVSFFVARAARLDSRQATAIAMELGVHNTTVALAIATTVGDELAGPAAVYGLFMFLTAGLFARLMARRNARAVAGGGAFVDVRGTPEVVWPAVATADGLSTWFAPTRLAAGEITIDLGPLGEAQGRVVAQERPRRFAFAEDDLATELTIDDLGDGRSRVRVTNEPGSEAIEQSWRPHLEALRLHVEHHAGERAEQVDLTAPGEDLGALDGLLHGEVVHEGPGERVLRLADPAPGHAVAVIDEGVLTVSARFYGHAAPGAAHALREAWAGRRASAPA